MTAYSKTWSSDSPSYNALTERALEKTEAEAVKMWQAGRNSATPKNSSWAVQARAFNADITNNSGTPILVVISIECNAVGSATVGGAASATAVIDPNGTPYTVGKVSANSGILGTRILTHPLMFVVNDGETYRVNTAVAGAAGSSLTRIFWLEFEFDAVSVAQAYTTGEGNDGATQTAKLNVYANAVNDLAQSGAAIAYVSRAPVLGTSETVDDKATLVILNLSVGAALDDGEITVAQKDNGGTLTNVGRVRTGQSDLVVIRSIAIIVNASGDYRASLTAGTTGSIDSTFELPMVLASPITFVLDEGPAAATGNKWRDLDVNASTGVNTTLPFTRVDAGTGTGSRTPSTTKFAVVALWVSLESTAIATASGDLLVGGTVRGKSTMPTGESTSDVMMLAITPANIGWSVNVTNAVVKQRTEWLIQ